MEDFNRWDRKSARHCFQNKCIYWENSCQKVVKTCLKIVSNKEISIKVCSSAPTSDNNKKYVLTKVNVSSWICEEVDKDESDSGINGSVDGNFGNGALEIMDLALKMVNLEMI